MKSNEWYTPAKYIEAARKTMGGIDLDPASCELANQTVKADRYYTKEENGLMLPWYGRVWLNPPYGKLHPDMPGDVRSWQEAFMAKLLQAYETGQVEQAIVLLLGNSIFNAYYKPFWKYLACVHRGALKFYKEDGSEAWFGFGSLFVYLGHDTHLFIEHFSPFGPIVKAISPIPSQPLNLELFTHEDIDV